MQAFFLKSRAPLASGPPVVGCNTGSSCMIEINYYVTYGGSNGVVVTPPPCIAVPVGDDRLAARTSAARR